MGIEVSSTSRDRPGRRKRLSGMLDHSARGLVVRTDAGDLWVLDRDDVDSDLLGQRVTVEGELHGLDRIRVDWIGESAP